MESFKARQQVGPDGILHLDIPVGLSDREVEVMVIYQPIPSDRSPVATIAIASSQKAEDLQATIDVFNTNPLSRQCPIVGFRFPTQWPATGFLLGQLTVAMQLLDALIALINQALGVAMKVATRDLKDLEIVLTSFAEEGAHNPARIGVNDELAFEGMAFLLAGVIPSLSSFGAFDRGFRDIHHPNVESPLE